MSSNDKFWLVFWVLLLATGPAASHAGWKGLAGVAALIAVIVFAPGSKGKQP